MPFASSTAAPCPAHVLVQPQSQEMDFFSYPKDRVLFAPQGAHHVLFALLGRRAERLLEPPVFSSDGEMEKFSGAAETIPLHLEKAWRALVDFAWICCMHRVSEGGISHFSSMSLPMFASSKVEQPAILFCEK